VDSFFIFWLGAVGATVGSFLNVVIYRLPLGKSIVSPPSQCPRCKQRIRWYDNLPIFGWFLLGGKCRDCKKPISFRYPLIESIACAIVTTFSFLIFQTALPIEQAIVQVFLLSVLHLFLLTLGMIVVDRQTLKPMGLSVFLMPFLILSVVFQFRSTPWEALLGITAALILGLVFTKMIRVDNNKLWFFALFALGGFLGWEKSVIILLATIPCEVAIVFITRRSYAVLSLTMMSFCVNVFYLVRTIPQ